MMNIDVVADGVHQNPTLSAAAQMLPDAIRCRSVDSFVQGVLDAAGDEKVRRLRLFAHASPGRIACGHVAATATLESDIEHLTRHGLKYIAVMQVDVRDQNSGRYVQTRWPMLNVHRLEPLRAAFDDRSYVELHCCRVAEGQVGQVLLRKLEQLWCCPVYGSAAVQTLGGGLEGTVLRGGQNQCQCVDLDALSTQ